MEGIVRGQRHPLANEKGGFKLQDPDKLIPEAAVDLFKKIGGKMVKMQIFDLMKISGPAKISHHTTFIE
jgi:hypothetical protein